MISSIDCENYLWNTNKYISLIILQQLTPLDCMNYKWLIY